MAIVSGTALVERASIVSYDSGICERDLIFAPSYLVLRSFCPRGAVYVVLGPTGSDHHYEVIESILREGRFPMAEEYAQAFHPPAYYLLSLPWAMLGGDRFVEVFSLLLSIAESRGCSSR